MKAENVFVSRQAAQVSRALFLSHSSCVAPPFALASTLTLLQHQTWPTTQQHQPPRKSSCTRSLRCFCSRERRHSNTAYPDAPADAEVEEAPVAVAPTVPHALPALRVTNPCLLTPRLYASVCVWSHPSSLALSCSSPDSQRVPRPRRSVSSSPSTELSLTFASPLGKSQDRRDCCAHRC